MGCVGLDKSSEEKTSCKYRVGKQWPTNSNWSHGSDWYCPILVCKGCKLERKPTKEEDPEST